MHITAKITFIHFNSYLVSKTVWDTLLTKREHLPAYLLCSSFYHFNSAFSRTNTIDCQTHNDNYRWETTCPQSSHGTETRKGHWSCENLNNSYLVSKTVWDTLLTKREHLPAYLLCSSFYHFNSAFSRTNTIDCQTHNDNYRWETTCPQSSRGTETGKGHRSSENHINSYLVLKTVCNTLHTKREHSQKYLLCSSFYRSNSVFFSEPTLSTAKPTTTTSGEIYTLYPLYASADVSYKGRYGDDLVGLLWPGIVHCQDSKGIPPSPLLSRQTGCAVPTSTIIQLTWRQLLY